MLVSALKNRVADDLLKTSASVPQPILLARLNKKLVEELAMTAEAAHWTVESWALALGAIAQPLPVAKPAPVPPSSPPIIAKVAPTPPPPVAETLMDGRYRDNDDGTVTDVKNGLQWMRFSLGQEWKRETCVGEAKKYTWQEALEAARVLNRQGGYAGYCDWRVPTRKELCTLAFVYQPVFPNTPGWWYWSSSAYDDYTAWRVAPLSSHSHAYNKTNDDFVRLVRGGQ